MASKTTTAMKLKFGGKKTPKKSASKGPGTQRMGGVGYRKYEGRPMWLPNVESPAYLDGSLPGDRGFDPLGLSKPAEYLQMELDQLDQNAAVNKAGEVIGTFNIEADQVSDQSLAPYSEVFGIQRFRECELIHGRWAMLAALGVLVSETATGVSWVDAGKVELEQTSYFGFDLPFSLTQVSYIEAILMLGVEVLRNTEKDPEKRCYPGGTFDPLDLASDPERAFNLKEAEIKHARLAMVAFFGFAVQAGATGKGALGSLSQFGLSFQ